MPGAVSSSQDTGQVSKVSAHVLEVQGQQSEHRGAASETLRGNGGPEGRGSSLRAPAGGEPAPGRGWAVTVHM